MMMMIKILMMKVMKYQHDNNIKSEYNTTDNHDETIIKLYKPIISNIIAIMHVIIL
jgi:hypothetical protein